MADHTKRERRANLRQQDILCPRCGGFIPNDDTPGLYPGALSRTDNESEVCSQCGQEEALLQLLDNAILTKENWVRQ